MKEKDIQQIFKTKNKKQGVFELKLCKGTSMAFDHVADHQIEALKTVSTDEGLYHKIADSPVSWGGQRFTKPKPFDCFVLKNIPAYVVICWYIPRVKKAIHYIPVQQFIEKRNSVERKSITEEMSAEIAEEVVQM
jgi:penicillin-binding protein-related factor A (putative recombinase)